MLVEITVTVMQSGCKKRFRQGEKTGPIALQERYDYDKDPFKRTNLANDLSYTNQLARLVDIAHTIRTKDQVRCLLYYDSKNVPYRVYKARKQKAPRRQDLI